jgi:hypothetical protein
MRKMIFTLVLMIVFSAFSAAESTSRPISITVDPGLELSFTQVGSLVGTEKTENTLNVLASRLVLHVDILDYLSAEILAGYHSAYAKDPIDFTGLPLSLRWDREKFAGLLLGAAVSSIPYTLNDFSLKVRGEFIFVMESEKTWAIDLPLVSGQAIGDNSFTLLTLDATVQYEGFTGVTLFIGPRLNLLSGKFSADESIEDLSGQQEFSYRQKHLFGALAGAVFEIGDNWELHVKAGLLARTEFSLAVFYVF